VRAGALLLSSYSNNNNPRCGTDRLRDAWWAWARGGL